MTEDTKRQQAQLAYKRFCEMLDQEKWSYQKQEEDLLIKCGARGEDLSIDLFISVDAERQLVLVMSQLPYTIPEENRTEIALAVSVINSSILNGSLDFDLMSGKLVFRMTNSYLDSMISAAAYRYMIFVTCKTVDTFNDKLLMLNKGIIDFEKFVELFEKA